MIATNGTNYRDVESELKTIASKFGVAKAEGSPFKGENFMTPEYIAVRRLSNGIWFEISYGSNISRNGWMFGVTFMKNRENLYDLSECCHEYSEVEEVLEKVSKI